MEIFTLLARYFWVALLAVTAINAALLRRRFRGLAERHPERGRGYRQMLGWYLGVSCLLWGLMGAGILAGGVPHVFAYLAPAAGNLYVLAWHALLIGVWLLALVWVFLRGGAQFLLDHPGMLKSSVSSAWQIKLMVGLGALGAVAAELLLLAW